MATYDQLHFAEVEFSKHTGETDFKEAAVEDVVEVIGTIAFRDSRNHAKVQERRKINKADYGRYSGRPQQTAGWSKRSRLGVYASSP